MGTKVPVRPLTRLDTSSAVDAVNENFRRLSDAFDSALLGGGKLTAPIDADGRPIINVPDAVSPLQPVTLRQLLAAGLGVPGQPGENGLDGVGIVGVSVNVYGHLIVTLSDGTVIDAGVISGGPLPPAPVFTTQPVISPSSGTANLTQFTATPGSASNEASRTRVWLLNGSSISTTLTALPTVAGTLTYQEFSAGPGGTTASDAISVNVQAQVVTPPPTGATRTMAMGMGVAGFNYYSPNNTWIDYMKASEPYELTGGTFDALGYPILPLGSSNGNPLTQYLIPLPEARDTPVKFRVYCDGDMDFRITNLDGSGYHSTQVTKVGDHWEFTWTGPQSGKANGQEILAWLDILAIRTPATSRLSVVRDDEAALWLSGRVFRQTIISDFTDFTHVRFMNWHGTNNPDRTVTSINSISYASSNVLGYRNVPLEICVKFCQEANVDGWFCHHSKITDQQYLDDCTKIDVLTAAGYNAYHEYSNEVWNYDFQQNAYAAQQADAYGFSGNPFYKGAFWTGRRAQQLAKLTRGRTKYRWVVGAQPYNADQDSTLYAGIETVSGYSYADFFAQTTSNYTAGFMNLGTSELSSSDNALRDSYVANNNFTAAFDNVQTFAGPSSQSVAALKAINTQHKTNATAKGITRLMSYEGNLLHANSPAGVSNPSAYRTFLDAMIAHPLTEVGTTLQLEAMQQAGLYAVTMFDYDSKATNTYSGNYGLKGTPAFNAILQWAADYQATGEGGGTPPPDPTPTILFNNNFDSSANGTLATALGLTGFGTEASQFQVLDGHLDWVKGSAPSGLSFVGKAATASHSVDYTLQAYNFANFGLAGIVSAVDVNNFVYIRPFDNDSYPGLIVWRLMKVVDGTVTADDNGYAVTPNTDGAAISIRKVGPSIMFYFGGTQYDFSGFRSTLSPSTGVGRSITDLGVTAGTNAGIFAQESAGAGGTRWVDNVVIKSL